MLARASQRRYSIRQFYLNGAIWGLGNGLVSSSLITYLASEYGAKGIFISLILAAPHLVGVLRLGTPLWIARIGDARKFCIYTFLLSSFFLVSLAMVTPPGVLGSRHASLTALVALWTIYHFFEYVGVVALWSWIGDTVPRTIRGRFIGNRGAILNACQVTAMIASGWGNFQWKEHCQAEGHPEHTWYGYTLCAALGATFMASAVWPLLRASNASRQDIDSSESNTVQLSDIFAPFRDAEFRRFLAYGGWFSFSNGIAILPITIYRIYVLGVSYGFHLTMDGASQGVQSLVMPGCGRALDRWGGVPILTISQVFVALAMVFYLLASPSHWWWIVGSYVLWIAYAGINTAMPKLMLSFSPPGQYAAYSAAWFATLELVFGLTLLAGGLLFDWAKENLSSWLPESWQIDHFTVLLALGLVLRLTASVWASRIREP